MIPARTSINIWKQPKAEQIECNCHPGQLEANKQRAARLNIVNVIIAGSAKTKDGSFRCQEGKQTDKQSHRHDDNDASNNNNSNEQWHRRQL